MAATVTHRGTTLNTTAGNKTVVATPAVGDLIVVFGLSTGVATTAVSDTAGGTYVQVSTTRTGFSTAGNLNAWVRTTAISSATSTTWTATQTSSTGGGLTVYSVSGMSKFGTSAVRSSGGQSTGTAATTPAPVLSLTPLASNPILTAFGNATGTTTNVTQRTGYTEAFDNGYATPGTGYETAFRASGETSATLTYGSTSSSNFATLALELDYNTAPTVSLGTPLDTASVATSTPALVFTGTDADSDDVRYEVQVDTSNTFTLSTPVYVGQWNTGSTTAGTGVHTYTVSSGTASTTVSPGEVIIWVLGGYESTAGTTAQIYTTMTDNLGASWTKAGTYSTNDGVSHILHEVWYCLYATSGTVTSISANFTGTVIGNTIPTRVSHMKYSGVSDVNAVGTSSNTTTVTSQSVAATVLNNNSLLFSTLMQWTVSTVTYTNSDTVRPGNTTFALKQAERGVSAGTSSAAATWPTASIASTMALVLSPKSLIDAFSGTNSGFSGSPDNSDPFTSGQAVTYTVQAGDALADGTYYWRVRGIDPSGSNGYGAWATTRSFTVATSSGVTVTPSIGALTLSMFAPTVLASNNQSVTPSVWSLTLTAFAPTVFASDSKLVTPSIATLALTTFAPTVTTTANQVVTPSVLSLSLSAFAPTITTTANVSATPSIVTLSLTTFIPVITVSDNKTVTPSVLSLSTASFAPTISISDNKSVTPSIATLTTISFAPVISVSDNKTVIPSTTSLSTSTFAPTVVATANVVMIPSVLSLTLISQSPSVTVGDAKDSVPGTSALSLTTFAPTVVASNHKIVIPSTTGLSLTTFAVTIFASDTKVVIPPTASLTLTTYAPTVFAANGTLVTPSTLGLVITTFVPGVSVSSGTTGGIKMRVGGVYVSSTVKVKVSGVYATKTLKYKVGGVFVTTAY